MAWSGNKVVYECGVDVLDPSCARPTWSQSVLAHWNTRPRVGRDVPNLTIILIRACQWLSNSLCAEHAPNRVAEPKFYSLLLDMARNGTTNLPHANQTLNDSTRPQCLIFNLNCFKWSFLELYDNDKDTIPSCFCTLSHNSSSWSRQWVKNEIISCVLPFLHRVNVWLNWPMQHSKPRLIGLKWSVFNHVNRAAKKWCTAYT